MNDYINKVILFVDKHGTEEMSLLPYTNANHFKIIQRLASAQFHTPRLLPLHQWRLQLVLVGGLGKKPGLTLMWMFRVYLIDLTLTLRL